jgi:hypothetical protein
VFAFATTLFARRRIYGAVVGACAAQGLVRFTDAGVGGAAVLLWLVAVGSVCASAYAVAPRRVRKQIHRGLVGFGAFLALGVVVFLVAIALAFGSTQSGAKQAKAGLAAVRDGHSEDGVTSLRESTASFTSAHDLVDAWWAKPAGAVPLLAQQLRAVQVVTAEGAALTTAAGRAASQADIQQLKYEDGRIDVERLAVLAPSLLATADELDHASTAIDDERSPWLVAPLAGKIDEVDDEVQAARPQPGWPPTPPRRAACSAPRPPATTSCCSPKPAEARGLGGFMGTGGAQRHRRPPRHRAQRSLPI